MKLTRKDSIRPSKDANLTTLRPTIRPRPNLCSTIRVMRTHLSWQRTSRKFLRGSVIARRSYRSRSSAAASSTRCSRPKKSRIATVLRARITTEKSSQLSSRVSPASPTSSSTRSHPKRRIDLRTKRRRATAASASATTTTRPTRPSTAFSFPRWPSRQSRKRTTSSSNWTSRKPKSLPSKSNSLFHPVKARLILRK